MNKRLILIFLSLLVGCTSVEHSKTYFGEYCRNKNTIEWITHNYRLVVDKQNDKHYLYAELSEEFREQFKERLGDNKKYSSAIEISEGEYQQYKEDFMAFQLSNAVNNIHVTVKIDPGFVMDAIISQNIAFVYFKNKLGLKGALELLDP